MPKISTLSGRTKFEYTLDGNGGFFIEYKSSRLHITRAFQAQIQRQFRNKTVPGGFCMTDPMPGGFGKWIESKSPFTPRHGSHIAAVLKDLGIIKRSYGQRPIMLEF